jgi:hypothetical protein
MAAFERADEGPPFADRADDRGLDRAHRLLEPLDDVGKQLVDALHLDRGQRRGARGVVADGIEVPEERLDVALELLGDLRHPPGGAAGDGR